VGVRVVSGGAELESTIPEASPRHRVLIIDDENLVVALLRRILESEYDVVTANSGSEGLEQLETDGPFGVVLCDLMLPDISGIEVYHRVERRSPELAARFVFLTGGIFPDGTTAPLDDLPNPRVRKPFDAQSIRAVVREQLGLEHGNS
jgi:CheY-like chemotaxis protein